MRLDRNNQSASQRGEGSEAISSAARHRAFEALSRSHHDRKQYVRNRSTQF
jgi:hypothetical protein